MHTRIVLVYTRIDIVTKHLFLSFLSIANIGLHFFFIVNHHRRERLSPSRVMLSSSMPADHHTCYPSRAPSGPVCHMWSFCRGQCCSRYSLVIGPFSQKHISAGRSFYLHTTIRRSSFKSSSSSSLLSWFQLLHTVASLYYTYTYTHGM